MAGKKVGSDGQVRKTAAEWTADTATYPEGMRLMNTDTGTVRVSKGTTYALAWTPSTGGGSNTDELTNNSSVSGATASDALNTLLGADQSLDSDKQDKLLSILTINDDNHSLTGTEYFIRATGTDPTWVTDTGNLDPGYPLELANDSTNDLTFVPDSGSNIVLSPGERASLRHRSGGAWISMFSGVDTALAGKADVTSLPKRYKWIGDGSATTGTVVANTLGVTINVTNPSTGRYVFTAASGTPFTVRKTTMSVLNLSSGAVVRIPDCGLDSTTVCTAYFADITEALADPSAYQVIIEVEP